MLCIGGNLVDGCILLVVIEFFVSKVYIIQVLLIFLNKILTIQRQILILIIRMNLEFFIPSVVPWLNWFVSDLFTLFNNLSAINAGYSALVVFVSN